MDRITFDFENNEITIENGEQHGVEIDPDLHNKKSAILAAAGYEMFQASDLIEEFKNRTGIDLSNLG